MNRDLGTYVVDFRHLLTTDLLHKSKNFLLAQNIRPGENSLVKRSRILDNSCGKPSHVSLICVDVLRFATPVKFGRLQMNAGQHIIDLTRCQAWYGDLMPKSDVDDSVGNLVLEDAIMDLFLLIAESHDAAARSNSDEATGNKTLDIASFGDGLDEVKLLKLIEGTYSADDGIIALQRLCQMIRVSIDIRDDDTKATVFKSFDLGLVGRCRLDKAANILFKM